MGGNGCLKTLREFYLRNGILQKIRLFPVESLRGKTMKDELISALEQLRINFKSRIFRKTPMLTIETKSWNGELKNEELNNRLGGGQIRIWGDAKSNGENSNVLGQTDYNRFL